MTKNFTNLWEASIYEEELNQKERVYWTAEDYELFKKIREYKMAKAEEADRRREELYDMVY